MLGDYEGGGADLFVVVTVAVVHEADLVGARLTVLDVGQLRAQHDVEVAVVHDGATVDLGGLDELLLDEGDELVRAETLDVAGARVADSANSKMPFLVIATLNITFAGPATAHRCAAASHLNVAVSFEALWSHATLSRTTGGTSGR